MMDESAIGQWMGRPGRPAHLVQTIRNDEAIMRCGKSMAKTNASTGTLEPRSVLDERCLVCVG